MDIVGYRIKFSSHLIDMASVKKEISRHRIVQVSYSDQGK